MDFLLHLIPTWAIVIAFGITIIILIGSDVVKGIPFIGKYGYFIMPVGIVIISLCVYLLTFRSVNDSWNQKVTELEHRMEILKEKSEVVNIRIEKEYIEVPIEKVITRNRVLREQVPIVITKENDCSIPKEAIELYNKSLNINE